ncbi:MAG TPA: LysR family transcriptional regulator, partial [Ktedonobacteraceae bacterium]|nr:LysR family transcriptional regulator [Ktedonobacteraceae bacterium]
QNFRKAAELCLVAQPALSRQIAALEGELGVELFKRANQRVSLTPAGREFAVYAQQALERLQQGQQAMASILEGQEGTVLLGCIEPLATTFLANCFRTFQQRYPRISLSVRVSRTDDVLNMVERAEVDLGLIFHPTIQREVLVVKELFRQPLRLLVPHEHAFLAQDPSELSLKQILTEPLLLPRATSRLRRIIDQALTQRGLVCKPVVEIDSIAGLKELVRQGCGITLLPAALLGEIPHEEKLVTLPLKELAEQFIFALVYRASGPISPPARQFINLLTMMAPSNI